MARNDVRAALVVAALAAVVAVNATASEDVTLARVRRADLLAAADSFLLGDEAYPLPAGGFDATALSSAALLALPSECFDIISDTLYIVPGAANDCSLQLRLTAKAEADVSVCAATFSSSGPVSDDATIDVHAVVPGDAEDVELFAGSTAGWAQQAANSLVVAPAQLCGLTIPAGGDLHLRLEFATTSGANNGGGGGNSTGLGDVAWPIDFADSSILISVVGSATGPSAQPKVPVVRSVVRLPGTAAAADITLRNSEVVLAFRQAFAAAAGVPLTNVVVTELRLADCTVISIAANDPGNVALPARRLQDCTYNELVIVVDPTGAEITDNDGDVDASDLFAMAALVTARINAIFASESSFNAALTDVVTLIQTVSNGAIVVTHGSAGIAVEVVLVDAPEPEEEDDGGLSGGAIAGIVIGVIAGTACCVFIVFALRKKQQKNKKKELTERRDVAAAETWGGNNPLHVGKGAMAVRSVIVTPSTSVAVATASGV